MKPMAPSSKAIAAMQTELNDNLAVPGPQCDCLKRVYLTSMACGRSNYRQWFRVRSWRTRFHGCSSPTITVSGHQLQLLSVYCRLYN
jgi:hypothetical protein